MDRKNIIILAAVCVVCIIAIGIAFGVLKGNNNLSNDTLKSG